jgi:hypothetical protein
VATAEASTPKAKIDAFMIRSYGSKTDISTQTLTDVTKASMGASRRFLQDPHLNHK